MPVNSNEPLVSVIIPTYNHAQFLKEAITSVLQQTHKNWEILIINNYSEDNTIQVVNEFKNQGITLINFRNNGVIAASRNVGLKKAAGDFIAFLDSDDLWLPNKLKEQLEIFKNQSEILIVGTNLQTFPNGRMNALKIKVDQKISFKNLLQKNYFINSSVLIKKKVVDQIGFLDEDQRLRAVEDYDYWLKILRYQDNSGYVIKDDLILYRMHESNQSGSGFSFDFMKSYEKEKIILTKYIDFDQKYVNELIKLRHLRSTKGHIKFQFYNKKIKISQLFKNEQIKFSDKFEILFKGLIIFLLRFLKIKKF